GPGGAPEIMDVVGNVEGKRCLVVDDMIDTAGTLVGAVDVLIERGAREVMAAATHPVFSGPALERVRHSALTEVIVTNTLPLPTECLPDKITVISIAPILASTIRAVFHDDSVSEIFQGENQEAIPPELRSEPPAALDS
ncbi:MAG: ribose-phosphate diphosphokinase, partial [Actinomycetota bacterium]